MDSVATWLSNTNNCIFIEYCEDPTPGNGSVKATKSPITTKYYYVSTTVSFTCDSGYKLNGGVSSTCQTNGLWNPSPPTCKQGNEPIKNYTSLLYTIIYYILSVLKCI